MCLIEDQSWIDCINIISRWDTFVLFHLYGNKGVSLPLGPIRPRWFHTFCPCAEPLGDGHEGMWARFGSQGLIALNWHSRYSGTHYSGTWLYMGLGDHVLHTLDSTVDYRYLAPVGSQNSRTRFKWFSRWPQPVTCRITDLHSGVYNSQTLTVCWAIIDVRKFPDLYTHWLRTSNKSQQAT